MIALFWNLLFAHFVADYPLQTNWIARNKKQLPVLGLHVFIHFLTMAVITGTEHMRLWPYLLLLTAIHFILDTIKIRGVYNRWDAGAVVIPYIIDQLFHVITIAGVTYLITRTGQTYTFPLPTQVVLYALGVLLVTQVWYISERVVTVKNPFYQAQVIKQALSRMSVRALILIFLLLAANAVFPVDPLSFAPAVPAFTFLTQLPYNEKRTRVRAILTDFIVSFCVALLIRLAPLA